MGKLSTKRLSNKGYRGSIEITSNNPLIKLGRLYLSFGIE
jgi:hypothetical protein